MTGGLIPSAARVRSVVVCTGWELTGQSESQCINGEHQQSNNVQGRDICTMEARAVPCESKLHSTAKEEEAPTEPKDRSTTQANSRVGLCLGPGID